MADEGKSSRFGNIKAQLSDGSTRIRFFGGLAIIVVAMIIAYVSLRKSVSTTGGLPSEVPMVPSVGTQPGQANDPGHANPAYDQLIAKENATKAVEAQRSGTSAVPVIRPGSPAKADATTAAPGTAAAAPAGAPPAPTAAEVAAQQQAAQQQRQEEQKARQEAITAKASAMKSQVNLLITAWQPKDHVSLAVREAPKESAAAALSTTAGAASGTAGAAASARIVAKAGDTFFVIPETVANNGGTPTVTAVIMNKALKGTKILGKVEMPQNAEGGVLRFTVANVDGYATSQTIDAVAIDPQFINVDNHYLLRTAAVLGSSFLSGFGEGLLKGGQQQQTVASTNGIVIQTDPYSTKQLVQIGMGNVGKTVASNVGTLINKAPTVSVDQEKAQTGFAIILLSDMTLK